MARKDASCKASLSDSLPLSGLGSRETVVVARVYSMGNKQFLIKCS